MLKGLASQLGQENDLLLVDGIRNSLFGPPGAGGLDLAALDIQRGRDHGLPDYNNLRASYGLDEVTSFAEISSDPAIQAKLEELFGNVDNIDPFVGALAEDHLPGTSVGAAHPRASSATSSSGCATAIGSSTPTTSCSQSDAVRADHRPGPGDAVADHPLEHRHQQPAGQRLLRQVGAGVRGSGCRRRNVTLGAADGTAVG